MTLPGHREPRGEPCSVMNPLNRQRSATPLTRGQYRSPTPHRAIPGYEPAKTSTIRDSVNPQTIPSQRSGAPQGRKGIDPGDSGWHTYQSAGGTPKSSPGWQPGVSGLQTEPSPVGTA